MKKTFLARRNALLSGAQLSWGAYALAFAFLMFVFRLALPNAFASLAAPVLEASGSAAEASDSFFGSFADARALVAQNEQLKTANIALSVENEALRLQVAEWGGLARTPEGVVVGVLARPPLSPYDSFVVAGGLEDGIREGMGAYGPGGIPIGRVSAVLDRFARVSLFSAPQMRLSGWVRDVPIEIVGEGGGAFAAVVPRTAGAQVGDPVYAPGPGKIPMGAVARIDSDPTLSGVTLRIQSLVNLFSLGSLELREAVETARAAP